MNRDRGDRRRVVVARLVRAAPPGSDGLHAAGRLFDQEREVRFDSPGLARLNDALVLRRGEA